MPESLSDHEKKPQKIVMAQVNTNIFIGIPGLVHVLHASTSLLAILEFFGKAFCEQTCKSTDEEQIKGAVTVLKKAL